MSGLCLAIRYKTQCFYHPGDGGFVLEDGASEFLDLGDVPVDVLDAEVVDGAPGESGSQGQRS